MKTISLLTVLATINVMGCSGAHTSYRSLMAHTSVPRGSESVDVLFDGEPSRPFHIVGDLSATTLESPRSVKLMREEAAREGLDGIYWIECASAGSGACKAKGFVYATLASAATVESVDSKATSQR